MAGRFSETKAVDEPVRDDHGATPPVLADAMPRSTSGDATEAATAGVLTCGLATAAQPPLPAIELSAPEVASRVGFRVVETHFRRERPRLEGNAEVQYNANLYAEVRPRVAGLVREVLVDEGTMVKVGQPMLRIDSAEVGTAKADLLSFVPAERLAQQTLDMVLQLRKANAAPLKDEMAARAALNRAKADVLHARQHLLNLGYSDEDMIRFETEQDTGNLHTVLAPLDGQVVERHAVSGEAVEATHKLFGVADTREMWAWIDVYEEEIEQVAIGQPVTLSISGMASIPFEGKVDWVDTAVNPTTRTIRVRAVLTNRDGRLRANEFGRATIFTGTERDVVVIPSEAVQSVGGESVVFLPAGSRRYESRRVRLGGETERGLVRVESGLEAGRSVVTTGSFLLKSELVKRLQGEGS